MKTYDRFEQLILDSELSAILLGNVEAGDYQLVALWDGLPVSPGARSSLHARGLGHVGIVALGKNGEFRTELAVPLADHVMGALAREFCKLMAGKLTAAPAPKGDSAAWLRRLFALPDTRTEN